jgi:hypothetical protein
MREGVLWGEEEDNCGSRREGNYESRRECNCGRRKEGMVGGGGERFRR